MAGRGRTGHCCRASCELSFSRVVGAMYAIVCSTVLAPCLAHIDVRVSKVDLEARMSSVRGMHCNGCASTATASTAMSSLSVECARPALHWMCASTAMSCGYYCANYRDHDDRRRTVTALKYRHMIRHTTNGIHIGRIKLSLISNLRPTVGIIRTPAVYKVLCCSAHF